LRRESWGDFRYKNTTHKTTTDPRLGAATSQGTELAVMGERRACNGIRGGRRLEDPPLCRSTDAAAPRGPRRPCGSAAGWWPPPRPSGMPQVACVRWVSGIMLVIQAPNAPPTQSPPCLPQVSSHFPATTPSSGFFIGRSASGVPRRRGAPTAVRWRSPMRVRSRAKFANAAFEASSVPWNCSNFARGAGRRGDKGVCWVGTGGNTE